MTRKSSTVGKAKQQTGQKEPAQRFSVDAQVESIRQLAWTGQHAAAIDSATRAFATPKIKIAGQMSLLDLRAESYIAIGKLDLALQDAKAMGKIGRTSKVKGLEVQALNRLALVQMRMGDLQAAVKSATAAVKTAKTTRDSALLAHSLYRLAEAQFRSGQNETAAETAQKAIPLFEAVGDLSGAGRAYWALALAYLNLGNAGASRPAGFTALELCQQAGDQYGIGNAFNVISFTDTDLVENMQHLQQAIQAFENAGYVERRAAVTGNLSNVYGELGLNPHARRLYSEGAEIARRIGAKIGFSVNLGNLISTELVLGLYESALSRVEEFKQVTTALGDPVSKSTFETLSAEFALAKGDPRSAVRHYKAALKIDHESGSGKEIDNLALSGSMHIANGDPAAALKVTQKAVELYRSGVFTQQSFMIWWRYAQALTANKKTKEASQALEQAYNLLLERVANVRDEGYRRNFLNKVEDNRKLLQHWVKDGAKRKLLKERIYAHLAVETNIREPFKRLADTGLRLNALKTVEEIQTFLVEQATELSGGERVLLILENQTSEAPTNGETSEVYVREVVESILPSPSYQSSKGYEKAENPQDVLKRIGKYLDQARLTRMVQLIQPKKTGTHRIISPLIAQNQILGYLYIDMDSLYGSFDATDRDMLGMLANQGAVALDNAGLLEGLERKVEERTEQLQERVDELQIINAIQQGLAAELDFQAIVDLVGDKLSQIFKTGDLGIGWYDKNTNLMHYLYMYEHGKRLNIPPTPPFKGGQFETMLKTRQPIVLNTINDYKKINISTLPGTDDSKSMVSVPIISSDRVLGAVSLENYERENAFGESELRLLTTIAASLGTALENARLFDETQRLLKITEERNAELAIINSVQAALAAELNIQGIYDAVGDKIREIFQNTDMNIRVYDPKTNLVYYSYVHEKDQRIVVKEVELSPVGFGQHVLRTRETLVINENMLEEMQKFGSTNLPGTDYVKSAVFVPLVVGEQARGLISVNNSEREHAFSESDVRLLQTLANSMSVALENARLFDETQRLLKITEERNAELAIINSVQAALAAELNIQGIYDAVGDKIREIFQNKDVGIRVIDPQTNMLHFPYAYESGERISIDSIPLPEKSMTTHIFRTRETIVINENIEQEDAKYGSFVLPGTLSEKSLVMVPLIAGDQVRGLIELIDMEHEHAFSESDVRLLTTLANSMSVALENARLFDETQRLLKITEERNAELAIINSVQAALAAELNIQGIYDAVGDKIREIFRNTDMDIRIYDPETNLMHYPYTYEGGERLSLEPNPVGEKGFEAHLLRTRQTLVINENIAEVAQQYGATIIPGTQMEKSAVYVPLIAGDQARGLIAMVNMQHEHAFSESDVRLLQTLANSMSVALENARLFNETQQRNAELAIINSVQQALAAELNIQGIYEAVGGKIREIFQNKDVGIRIYDPQTGLIFFPYLYESGERVEVEPFPMTDKGFAAHVMRTGEAVVINANMEEEEKKYGSFTIPGTRSEKSLVMVPLFGGDQRRGAIDISDYEKEYAFTASDVRLLQTLANSMSVALENARLFAETQRLLKESNTLAEVGREISSSLDAKVVLENIVSYAMNLLGGELSALFTPEEDGAIFRAIAAVGEHAEQIRNETIRAGAGILGDIAEKKKAEIVNNAEKDPRTLVVTGTEVLSHEHMLVVPLMANEDLKGLMAVWRTGKDKDFTENELTFITSLSRQAVIALRNSQLYKEAQELRVAAEHANTAKSTFMANMSHELRTPLNAIIGFTRIVRRKAEGVLPEKQTENLDKVLSSGEHLLGLINTVLDIAKVEAGRMDVQALNFNIGSLIDQCANLAAPLLKPTVDLEKQVSGEVGMIYSDQEKIKQIVLNLLSNAAKFTHAGRITLSAWQADAIMHISVADSGIGITEEALGRIFEEFQQADTSTTRQYGGTGLGLSISRNLARLLGGDLTATSEYGKGSTFMLTIPIKYGTKTASTPDVERGSSHPAESTPEAGARKLILVIDDDPDADYLLQENLNRNEFEVIGARNGHDGLMIAREKQPHAILLDILMPDTDGWQVLHDLKADAATKDIPVVLLTIVDKKALGFRLGASAYLLKPLKPDEVLNALRQVIKPKPDALIHVLAVDDDPHIADMLRQQLPESEFSVESALDGEAGLAAIEARLPDVLLLDIMMPKLDGFGVLENIRKDPATRDLPVIVISAKELTAEESARLTESVVFIMRKQGFDGVKLAREIKHSLHTGA